MKQAKGYKYRKNIFSNNASERIQKQEQSISHVRSCTMDTTRNTNGSKKIYGICQVRSHIPYTKLAVRKIEGAIRMHLFHISEI